MSTRPDEEIDFFMETMAGENLRIWDGTGWIEIKPSACPYEDLKVC